jgi:hypothetical protein
MSGFSNWLGNALGVEGGIQSIGSGYAALLGFFVVSFGWIINARAARHAYRIENARNTVLFEDETLRDHLKKIAPYLRELKQFPDFNTLRTDPQYLELHGAVSKVLNSLELLALDISTGRASERYVIQAQRTLICNIFVSAQDYISSLRTVMNQKGAYHNLELLFIRLYINRHPYGQYFLEFLLGHPSFRYSYLLFRFRYLLIANNIGIDPDYRKARWPDVQLKMRALRRLIIALCWAAAASVAIWVIFLR